MKVSFSEICDQFLVASLADYIFFNDIYVDLRDHFEALTDTQLLDRVLELVRYLLDHGLRPFNARGPDVPVEYWNCRTVEQIIWRIEREWPDYVKSRDIMGICWFGYPNGIPKNKV